MKDYKSLYFAAMTLICLFLTPCATSAKEDVVRVWCVGGHAPSLPSMMMIDREWRQVKWDNTSVETECEEASMAIGAQYSVSGVVLGTDRKVSAMVTVVKDNGVKPVIKAHPLPLSDVRLTGDNILTRNRNRDIERLLSLDVSQQLYNYHDTYGLPTAGMTKSDGWDSPETKLKGHGVGHYLSALALAYAGIDDAAKKAALLERIDTIVTTMTACQSKTRVWCDSLGRYYEARDVAPGDSVMELRGTWKDFDSYKRDYRHYGYGYINTIPPQHLVMIEAYRPYNNEQWVWAPYYTVHKQLAGLIDVAELVDDRRVAAMAQHVATDMALWVWNRLHYRTFNKVTGTKEERRAQLGNRYEMWNMYIAGEVGGMQEVLARLAEMTTDESVSTKLVEAAMCFDAEAFYKPLSMNLDDIRTRHANQHIPMITGALRLYGAQGNTTPYYYNIASNFWNLVQGRYAYSPGGVGNGEMFRQPYMQMTSMLPNSNINETCCAYNLAKLSRDLACYNPDDARYMDYYERLLYNQIVGSLSQREWAVTYHYAVGLDATKQFGNDTPQSSCCGGTGVENHVRYQESAYYVSGDTLWVNQYLPTVAQWREKGLQITMQCEWPAETVTMKITGDNPCAVKLRVPYWATKGFVVKVNGRVVLKKCQPCSYVMLQKRLWKETDKIEIVMPYEEHLSYGPDLVDGYWVATKMRGPLCMVAENVTSWDEADMRSVKSFVPDYAFTDHGTHYLKVSKAVTGKRTVDMKTLRQTVRIAAERENNPAAWAPHAFKRMQHMLQDARKMLEGNVAKADVTQADIDKLTSSLNTLLNTMRPSTLAEPEDVKILQERVAKLRKDNPTPDEQLATKLDYADMVIRYVLDGSGTHDMIKKALDGLE